MFSPSPSLNFYCPNCEKISNSKQCEFCANELKVKIIIPKVQVLLFDRKNKEKPKQKNIVCPRCQSSQTRLTFSAEWD